MVACEAMESITKSPTCTPNSAKEYVVTVAAVAVGPPSRPAVLIKFAALVSEAAPFAFSSIWHPRDAYPVFDAVDASRLPVGALVAPPAWSAIVTLGPAVDADLEVKLPGSVSATPPLMVVYPYTHTNWPLAKLGATEGARSGAAAAPTLAIMHWADVSTGLAVSHPVYVTAVVVVQLAPLQVIVTLVGSPAWYAL